jgi:hypothetical protein
MHPDGIIGIHTPITVTLTPCTTYACALLSPLQLLLLLGLPRCEAGFRAVTAAPPQPRADPLSRDVAMPAVPYGRMQEAEARCRHHKV